MGGTWTGRIVVGIAIACLVGGCAGSGASSPPSNVPSSAASSAPSATPPSQSPSQAAISPAPTVELTGFAMRGFNVGLTTSLYFAVDSTGNLYLPSGTGGSALVKVAPDGHVLARWAGLEIVQGQPDTIVGIAIQPGTGDLFASDTTADRVVHLAPDLAVRSSFGSTGPGPGQFTSPGGLAFDPQGHLLVADMGNDRIETFTPEGKLLDVWNAPGGLTGPVDVTTDQQGNIYVSTVQPVSAGASATAGGVLEFSSGHDPVQAIGAKTHATFTYPNAAVAANGNVYVADPFTGLQVFGADGKAVAGWDIPGGHSAASAVRVGPSGRVYTINCSDLTGDCRIAAFDPDSRPAGQLVTAWHAANVVTPIGTKVDVGGHSLYLQCVGSGSPTIVWEAGGGSSGWVDTEQYLMGRLASISRVCVYDRAGLGFSDGSSNEEVWLPAVSDLHALLQKAGVAGPYVIAGYSHGGLIARLYAYTYPNDVAGLVLVDPSHEDQYAGPVDPTGSISSCSDSSCPAFADIQAIHAMTHGKVAGSLGALPLIVLGRALPTWGSKEYDAYWEKLGVETAAASSNSVHVVASWSSHLIPYAQPGLVIEAVSEVVAAARAAPHTLPACGSAFTQLGGLCQ